MYKTISALKARQNLGQVMNEVALKGDDYIIERAGKPLVAVIPMEKYQSLQRDWDEFLEGVSAMSANIKEEDYETVDKLVDEAVRAYRKPKAKKRCSRSF
jgi:prevent-host-death family protein